MKRSSIQNKEKPCRGQGLAKGHGCGKPTMHRVLGMGKMCGCYSNWLLSTDEGKRRIQNATLKVSAPRIEMEKAFEEKKSRESLSWLKENVKTVVHEYIRARDKGKPCISCGQPWKPDFQAGHFYKAELFSDMKYLEENISGQCCGCNLYADGNESGYRVGIINRYGEALLHSLDNIAANSKKRNFKWDREELIGIRNEFREKMKALKASGGVLSSPNPL